ncbi:MAG: phage tail protein [bacterium]
MEKYPYRVYNFKVTVGAEAYRSGSFRECSGLDSSNDVIEYRDGTDAKNYIMKMPGLGKYSNITLKYGVIETDSALWTWILNTRNGTDYANMRKDVSITLVDDEGTDKIEWTLENAWPTKWTGAGLNATGNEVAIESIELAHEGISKWESK